MHLEYSSMVVILIILVDSVVLSDTLPVWGPTIFK